MSIGTRPSIIVAVAGMAALAAYGLSMYRSGSVVTVSDLDPSAQVQIELSDQSPEVVVVRAESQNDMAAKSGRPGVESASPVDWMNRIRDSLDYWGLANEAAPAAADGDARAQYVLSRALGKCNTQVELYRRIFPDERLSAEQIIEATTARKASRSSVSVQVLERGREDFMKCARFFDGVPPALSRLQLGAVANTSDYWLSQALDNSDPLAHMDQASLDLSRLNHLDDADRPEVIESIRQDLTLAATSADPEAWFQVGKALAYAGSTVVGEWAAWEIAACESGYDCSYSNPEIGNGCIAAGTCAAADTLILQMQRELGGSFGASYARSQEILFAFENGDGDRIVEELLDRIDLAE